MEDELIEMFEKGKKSYTKPFQLGLWTGIFSFVSKK